MTSVRIFYFPVPEGVNIPKFVNTELPAVLKYNCTEIDRSGFKLEGDNGAYKNSDGMEIIESVYENGMTDTEIYYPKEDFYAYYDDEDKLYRVIKSANKSGSFSNFFYYFEEGKLKYLILFSDFLDGANASVSGYYDNSGNLLCAMYEEVSFPFFILPIIAHKTYCHDGEYNKISKKKYYKILDSYGMDYFIKVKRLEWN